MTLIDIILDDTLKKEMPKPINKTTALGICLIGNLGFHQLHAKAPSLGFIDMSVLENGIPCHLLES